MKIFAEQKKKKKIEINMNCVIRFVELADFLSQSCCTNKAFNLVLMENHQEWRSMMGKADC